MIPVKQTILHDPENGHFGNCAQAAIASIFNMNIERVPHFADGLSDDEGAEYQDRLIEWLKPMGYGWLCCSSPAPEDLEEWNINLGKICDYHLITGMSPRGFYHVVVGKAGQVIHDPHPSNAGLLENTEENPWIYEFIIRR